MKKIIQIYLRTLLTLEITWGSFFETPSRTNLKLKKVSVTPKMVKGVTMNLDSSKASDPDFFTVV